MTEIPIVQGFGMLFSSWEPVFFALLGTLIGILAGAIPGLTASAIISLMIPITFYMDTLSALAFIYTISKSASFGGSIPAILFNTPGTPQASATQLDGYPLTRQGKQSKALRTAVIASAIGDTFSELLLIFGAIFIAFYALKMGPPEYTAVYFCAFVIISSVIGSSIAKGMISTLLGILFAMIGYDSITAEQRYTFGYDRLEDGLSFVPVLLGLFVMSEVLIQVENRIAIKGDTSIAPPSRNPEDNRLTWPELKSILPTIARSTGYGTVIGALPGIGATVAVFVAYSEARRASKHPERFGKGAIEGVAACEAANNATSGANIIPLLTLGIPGSTVAALLSGVMLIHGITAGPQVFQTHGPTVFGLFAAGLLCIATYLVVGYWGSVAIGRLIAMVPAQLVYPFIFITCFVAAFALRQTMSDLAVMLVFGIVGYGMKKFDFSIPAFIIAFILAEGAEQALRQTMMLSDGGVLIFLERPIALAFFALGILTVVLRMRQLRRHSAALRDAPATAE
jgi:putative tricarboxylic transport membrane protein